MNAGRIETGGARPEDYLRSAAPRNFVARFIGLEQTSSRAECLTIVISPSSGSTLRWQAAANFARRRRGARSPYDRHRGAAIGEEARRNRKMWLPGTVVRQVFLGARP